ncbi:MAG: hypothetical protein FWG93_07225 [Oscillospiraceae bacterium]|nr:hypothetical protein [Oscillospiraceae bacterium]
MKRKYAAALLLAVAVMCVFSGCASDAPDMSEFDFSFSYGVRSRGAIDTYNNTLKKDLVIAGTETVTFVMPEEDKRMIFDALFEYGVDQLPEKIEPSLRIDPADVWKFKYTYKGETKIVEWDNALGEHNLFDVYYEQSREFYDKWYQGEITEALWDFLRFKVLITEYIRSTEAYQNMPEAEGGYQ